MPTVRTETVEYRCYELRAVEWMGSWQVSITPATSDLPLPLAEDVPSAPRLDEALAKARWRVDRMLDRR